MKFISSKTISRILLLPIALWICGCASTSEVDEPVPQKAPAASKLRTKKDAKAKKRSTQNKSERLRQARLARDRYLKILEKADTVAEVEAARAALNRVQTEIEELEEYGVTEDRFKKRTLVYGPVGLAAKIAEWIGWKLYIIYHD